MWQQIESLLDNRKIFLVIFTVLTVCLFFISIWNLSSSPATWFDEGINIGIARSLVEDGVYSLKIAPQQFVETRQYLITTNYPVLLPVALSVYVFGHTLVAARMPMVLFLWLFAGLAFIYARRMYGKWAALAAYALIVSFIPLYGNGKNVLGEVPGLVFLLAGLLILQKTATGKRLFISGLLFGVAAATKPFYLLIVPMVCLGEWYYYVVNRSQSKGRFLILMSGMVLPLLVWFTTIIPTFSFTGLASIFGYYTNSYAATHIGSQILRNSIRFVSETTPLHFTLLFVVSATMLYQRHRKKVLQETEVILGLFIVATALWYLKTPGWYRYFFPAHLLLFLFFPAALLQLVHKKIAFAVCVCLCVFQFGFLVSKRYDPLYYSSESARAAEFVDMYVPDDASILIVNSPSVAFLTHHRQTYQFLQINPTLFFGHDSLGGAPDAPYQFIVMAGGVDGTALAPFAGDIVQYYRVISRIGRFVVYQRI